MSFKDQVYRVNVPVADLRKSPFIPAKQEWVDRDLLTQLLFDEEVVLHHAAGDFCFVEALGQEVFNKETGWSGYKGFIHKDMLSEKRGPASKRETIQTSHAAVYSSKEDGSLLFTLSYGTGVAFEDGGEWLHLHLGGGKRGYLRKEAMGRRIVPSPSDLGSAAVFEAKKFLGCRYLWGGRSSPADQLGPLRGVDCSSLVHLCYKGLGVDLPRDAHDQFLKAEPICFDLLKPGDLLFSSEKGLQGRIDHVMMVAGSDHLIESVMSQGVVRLISFNDKFGDRPQPDKGSQMLGKVAVHPARIARID